MRDRTQVSDSFPGQMHTKWYATTVLVTGLGPMADAGYLLVRRTITIFFDNFTFVPVCNIQYIHCASNCPICIYVCIYIHIYI